MVSAVPGGATAAIAGVCLHPTRRARRSLVPRVWAVLRRVPLLACAVLAFVGGPAWARLPTVVSTNLCADILALGLAAPQQLLSVSSRSHDARFSPMPDAARRHPANDASAEEIIALRPDVVLASRRWQARHQTALFERHGIRVVVVSFPATWDEIFAGTRRVAAEIGRTDAAENLLEDVASRLARLRERPRASSALYLRPNGGSAGANTYVDAVFEAAGVRNHATDLGQVGWGRFPLERLVAHAPDVFVVGDLVRDTAYARSAYARHAVAQAMFESRPVITMSGNQWGCSNWLLIEAAEEIAAQVDALAWDVSEREGVR